LVVIVIVAALGLGVLAVTRDVDASPGGSTLEIHSVTPISFDITAVASGELEAKKQTEIRSELETRAAIVEIAPEGRRVKKGDLLVKLASEAIEKEIDNEQLQLEAARSDVIAAENAYAIQVNENDAAMRQATLKLELAEIELNKWQEGDLPKRIEELDAAIEKAQRTLQRDEERYEKSQGLYEKGFLSKDELTTDRISFQESQSNLDIAKLNKRVFLEYEKIKTDKQRKSDVDEAKAEVERTKKQNESRLVSKEADLVNKRRQLALREERMAKLEEQFAATTIIAPTDGLVVYGTSIGDSRGRSFMSGDGPMEIGREVRPNELIMILPDTTRMMASVQVHESIAGRISEGQPATIRIDALPNANFKGVVESIGVLAESGGWRDPNRREYTVKIDIEDHGRMKELKPSMRCDSEIIIGKVETALAAPIQAVFRDGPVSYVYTPKGSKYERTPVALGRRSSTYVEFLGGVNEGTRVLLREPKPGEVLDTEFDPEQIAALAAASGAARRQMMMGGMSGMDGPQGQPSGENRRPQGEQPRGDSARPASYSGEGESGGGAAPSDSSSAAAEAPTAAASSTGESSAAAKPASDD
ncbi:MAG: HlyD family efflux transporter periplasmic adaptor subunit, partial [Planctomycetota bacterium]|nr:HlyD family efflux transporter periplasmic adaptor subunit [Planctomycetota bacterium]